MKLAFFTFLLLWYSATYKSLQLHFTGILLIQQQLNLKPVGLNDTDVSKGQAKWLSPDCLIKLLKSLKRKLKEQVSRESRKQLIK